MWWHGGARLTERSERGSLSAVATHDVFGVCNLASEFTRAVWAKVKDLPILILAATGDSNNCGVAWKALRKLTGDLDQSRLCNAREGNRVTLPSGILVQLNVEIQAGYAVSQKGAVRKVSATENCCQGGLTISNPSSRRIVLSKVRDLHADSRQQLQPRTDIALLKMRCVNECDVPHGSIILPNDDVVAPARSSSDSKKDVVAGCHARLDLPFEFYRPITCFSGMKTISPRFKTSFSPFRGISANL